MKKIISILLSVTIIACLFSGCGSKEESYDFIYPFTADVNSYDPQVASTSDEFLIIENCFEGLIRINDDGEIIPAMAEKWSISPDGLTYTFNIKKGMRWDIKTDKYKTGDKAGEFKDSRLRMLGKEFNPEITANDFVFALRRAADPNTSSPLFSSIACIKNANAIHNKKMKANALGVKAVDNYTLEIKLNYKDSTFMQTLASAVAMPCNEEFFNATKGRYGLDTKYTLFNGQFYVRQILETSYLLKANDVYTGPNTTKAKELTLKIVEDGADTKETVSRLESGYYDAAFISGRDSDGIKKNRGITYMEFTDTTWAFVLNSNDAILQSKAMRKAFCQGFSRGLKYDKAYLSNATSLIPKSCEINGNNSVSAIGSTIVKENQAESIKNWKKALGVLGTTDVEIIILAPENMQTYVKQMLQGIQGGLGSNLKNDKGEVITLTLKVQAMDEKDIRTAISKGEYDIAFLPFKAHSNSALSFLSQVSDKHIAGFNKKKVDNHIAKAQSVTDLNSIAKNVKNAEKEIINSYTICPMMYESSFYASAKGVNNVQFHPGTGRVSFINATRDE